MHPRPPLLDLSCLQPSSPTAPPSRLLAKAEFLNPTGSIKDRIAGALLESARQDGRLAPGAPVLVPSSGNTAAAMAAACGAEGHPCTVVTNHKCSHEKRAMAEFYGATVVVVEDDYEKAARQMAARGEGCMVDQYADPANARSYGALADEILAEAPGITHFVAGASTGGTLSGTGRTLKARTGGQVRVVLADPIGSSLASVVRTGEPDAYEPFKVEGVGKRRAAGNFDPSVVDDVVEVSDGEAFQMVQRVARRTRWCIGGSSGLNLHAALEMCAPGRTVVTVLPDHGLKYVSKFEAMGAAALAHQGAAATLSD